MSKTTKLILTVLMFLACAAVIAVATSRILESRQDRGLKGQHLPGSLPLTYHSDDPAWVAVAEKSAAFWNQACGLALFARTATATRATIEIEADPALGGDDTGFPEHEKPRTIINWIGAQWGTIYPNITIKVPPMVGPYSFEVRQRAILDHEFGHALGFIGPPPDFGHDDWETSVMYRNAYAPNGATRSYKVSDFDCSQLRGAY